MTYEAQWAGQGFDDLRALALTGLLRAVMIGEEKMILGGNTSVPLGTTPTPTVTDAAASGSLAANTTFVLTATMPATYQVVATAWPYLNMTVDVVAS